MLKPVIFAATAFFAIITLFGAPQYSFDFANQPEELKPLRWSSLADGMLRFRNGGSAELNLTANQPYKVGFRCRINKWHKGRSNSFFSINLAGEADFVAQYMFRDDMMVSYLTKNRKNRMGFGGSAKKGLELDKWYKIELTVMKSFVQVSVDGNPLGSFKYEHLIPLQKITMSSYCIEWDMDDFTLELLEQPKIETIAKPILALDFDDTLNGVDHTGKVIAPVAETAHQFATGISGKALHVPAGQRTKPLEYALPRKMDPRVGGVMFWIKQPQGGLFFHLANDKKNILTAACGDRYTIQIAQKGTDKQLIYLRSAPGNYGDWVLLALTWNEEGVARYYVNSLPYLVSFTPMQRVPDFVDSAIDEATKLIFPNNNRQSYTIDRLQFFQKTLTNRDVYEEYRRFMPVDMVMNNCILEAAKPVIPEVQVAPPGYYTKPMPIVDPPAYSPKPLQLQFQITDQQGKLLQEHTRSVTIDQPMDLFLPEITLAPGSYRLHCTVDGHYSRSWTLQAIKTQQYPPNTGAQLQVGRSLYSRVFNDATQADILKQGELTTAENGAYVEVGKNKFDRLSVEITFPKEVLGKPVALDITWPDDKARLMGWYMYPKGLGANRDRLQSGVSAGNEFPCSNRMVTTRHIFYPGIDKYLFECRTLASGMPAAIAKVEIFELPQGLPALKINHPMGIPGRHFGFYDEDQTFTNNLNADAVHPKSPLYAQVTKDCPSGMAFLTNELVRYFKYTGMDTAHLPLWRYNNSYFPLEGQTPVAMYPGLGMGSVDYIINALRQGGIRLIANMNLKNITELNLNYGTVDRDFRKEGLETLDNCGDSINRYLCGTRRGNIAHPEYFKLLQEYFDASLKRYANNPGFGGLEVMLFPIGLWESLEYGYDDWTVNKFSQDTGVKVQATTPKARFDELTTTHRKAWLKWRSEQVTTIVKKFRAMLDKYNPEQKLFLTIPQDEGVSQGKPLPKEETANYVQQGIDITELRAIPRVAITVNRFPTAYRHDAFWGKAESDYYGKLYNADPKVISPYLTNGVAQSVLSVHTYFETFVKPLHKDYPCYFEDADIKPHSRWYLRELAFAVAAFDAQEYVAGGQPLNTIGRDEESREFAQAYRALPARPFTTIAGITDPVVGRYLNTPAGTYFYLVNLFHCDITVEVDMPWRTRHTDLSTGKESTSQKFTLKPFQLRSFLVKGNTKLLPKQLTLVKVDKSTVKFYQERLAQLQKTANKLRADKLDVTKEEAIIQEISRALDEKRYAEVYRLAFTRDMNQLLKKEQNLSTLLRQQQQIQKGHYAINCGSANFFEAPDGVLFFPDQKFNGTYGYDGRYTSITRDITGLQEAPHTHSELYKTEAYELERYRFSLPNGKYKVVVHMKAGFKPNFLPKNYIFTLKINGKPVLHKFDMHVETNGDFTRPIRKEFPLVDVTNQELLLEWNHEQEKRGIGSHTICLANAIEVIRIK